MTRLYLILFLTPVMLLYSQNFDGDYPSWFLHPAANTNIYIGFGYSNLSAREDAVSMSSLFNECIVNGQLNMYSTEGSSEMYRDSDYYYYFDPDNKVVYEDELESVDRFTINMIYGNYIQAFASDSNYVLVEDDSSESEIPEWIKTNYYEDDTYFYGIGMYTSMGNKIDAWKTSEEKGIFSIILNNAVQVYKIKYTADSYDDNFVYDEIITYKFKYRLRGIETVERYPDYKNELFYTLVRIKKENVLAAF